MAYIDGMVCSVPDDRKQEFIESSRKWGAIAKEFGVLECVDCWGDDVPEGKVTSFPMAVQRKAGETVCFSWMRWPDKATRDAGMKAMMEDERLRPENNVMPFDGQRLIFGGFEVLNEG